MMSKQIFESLSAMSPNAWRVGMPVVAIALLALGGCGGDLANSPTGPELDELDVVPGPAAFSMTGQVFDADTGEDIEGAVVTVQGGGETTRAFSDANGTYHVDGLSGVVVVRAVADGYDATDDLRMRVYEDISMDFQMAADGDENGRSIPVASVQNQ